MVRIVNGEIVREADSTADKRRGRVSGLNQQQAADAEPRHNVYTSTGSSSSLQQEAHVGGRDYAQQEEQQDWGTWLQSPTQVFGYSLANYQLIVLAAIAWFAFGPQGYSLPPQRLSFVSFSLRLSPSKELHPIQV